MDKPQPMARYGSRVQWGQETRGFS